MGSLMFVLPPMAGDGYKAPGVEDFQFNGGFIPGVDWFNKPLVQAIIAAVLVLVLWLIVARNLKIVPSKGQFLAEQLYDMVRNGIARDILGQDFRKYLPYLLALFCFLLVNNWFGIFALFMFPTFSNIGYAWAFAIMSWLIYNGAGIAKHDHVAWAFARKADEMGVDIIQNCPVTAIRRGPDGRVTGVETAKGFIAAKKVAVSAAGHTSVVMETAGVRLPLESYPLQALVSEPIKPIFPCVVMSNSVHAYLSQSDKGELVIGSGTDQYVSYSQRGGLPLIEHTLAAICEIFPIFRRMRMLRKWGGIVDVTPDRSAILGKTPVPGLYVNCGWGTGGFKATPGAAHVLAHTVARDEPHPINAPFTLERFTTGRLIDEAAAAAVAH